VLPLLASILSSPFAERVGGIPQRVLIAWRINNRLEGDRREVIYASVTARSEPIFPYSACLAAEIVACAPHRSAECDIAAESRFR
jgi:hypothetical protein